MVSSFRTGMTRPAVSTRHSTSYWRPRRAERAIKNALKQSVNFENYEGLVKRATESGVITEEQATMVRLAQKASALVIAVDDFPREQVEPTVAPMPAEKAVSKAKAV